MKLKSLLLLITALLVATIGTSLAGAPSAKGKNGKANVQPKAQIEATIPGADVQPAAYFYTGKPYDEDLGGYVFNHRTYSPSINRWTTSDPSGFPDGANCNFYSPIPTTQLDPNGLWRILLNSKDNGTAQGPNLYRNGTAGLGGSYQFWGGDYASSSSQTAHVGTYYNGSGYPNLLPIGQSNVNIAPQIHISIVNGGLRFTEAGSWALRTGCVSIGVSHGITGEGTTTLTVRLQITMGFKATTISGGGKDSVELGESEWSETVSGGNYIFTLVEE